MEKSEQTKAKLVSAVMKLMNNGQKISRYGLLAFAILVSFLPIFNPLQIFSSLQNYSYNHLF